ncbi:MAG: ABC transporter ATP-binding protein [Bdellovibrionia bacterium]
MNPDMNQQEKIDTSLGYKKLLLRLWPYTRKHLGLFILVITSILTLALISRALPQLIGYAIDEGIKKQSRDVLIQVAWLYLGFEILKAAATFGSDYFVQILGNRVLYYLRHDLMQHVQSLPMEYYNKTQTGRIVTRLTTDVAALGDLFTNGLVSIFIQLVVMLAIVIAMLWISPLLTVATLAVTPLFIFLSIKISDLIRDTLREQKKKLSTMNSFVAENLNGIKVVQIYNRATKNNQLFQNHSSDYLKLSLKNIHAYALMQPVMNLFTASTIAIAMYYGGFLSLENAIPIGSLVAFLLHAQDFIPPLREIMEKYQQFQNSLTSAERVFSLLDEKTESKNHKPVDMEIKIRGELHLKDLRFKYADHLPEVLRGISLDVPAGSSLALVGRTGSGKSTLIALLQRFYDAPVDSIFIDHSPLESFDRQEIRKFIGVCQQDNFIFRGTILDNITLFDPKVSTEAAQRALDQIGYGEMLRRTGRDLNSPVEEKGANLSVGERQLLAFARILVFNPQILILDEATANIDSESERLIQNATYELMKNRTSIIIAHRLSTIQHCNQIAVLKEGQVVELGTHSELIERNGYYSDLAKSGTKSTTILESALGTQAP